MAQRGISTVKTIDVKYAQESLASCAQHLAEAVVVTKRGKPLVAVVPIAEEDLESLSLATNPDFLALLARSRARYKAEGGIPHAEICRRLGLKQPESVTARKP